MEYSNNSCFMFILTSTSVPSQFQLIGFSLYYDHIILLCVTGKSCLDTRHYELDLHWCLISLSSYIIFEICSGIPLFRNNLVLWVFVLTFVRWDQNFASMCLFITHYWIKTFLSTLPNAQSGWWKHVLFPALHGYQTLFLLISCYNFSSFLGRSAFFWILKRLLSHTYPYKV